MDVEKVSEKLGTERKWLRELFGELIGTFVLVFVGNCSVAQNLLTGGVSGTTLSVNLAYGIAVALGVLIAGKPSGGHLNPAVTLAMAAIGKLPASAIPHYFLGQFAGGFLSAALTYLVYYDLLKSYKLPPDIELAVEYPKLALDLTTAGIFTTYPSSRVSNLGCLVDQVLGTFILVLLVCAITDSKNMSVPKNLVPLYVGLVVMAIGMSLGPNCGYAINPARDLSPRIFVTIAGWNSEVFTFRMFFWIPVLGPCLGGILGALVYVFFIEIHHKKEEDDDLKP